MTKKEKFYHWNNLRKIYFGKDLEKWLKQYEIILTDEEIKEFLNS